MPERTKNLVYLAAMRVGGENYRAFCDLAAYADGKEELVLKRDDGSKVDPETDGFLFDVLQNIVTDALLKGEKETRWQVAQIKGNEVVLFLAEKFFAYQKFGYLRDNPFDGCTIYFVPHMTLEQAVRDIARFEGWAGNKD